MYALSDFYYEFQSHFSRDLLHIIYYKLYQAYSFFYKPSSVAIRVNISKFVREIFKVSYANIRGSRSIEYQIRLLIKAICTFVSVNRTYI